MKRTLPYWLWTAAIFVLVILHAIHPRADFPNHSPWMDYSKYTDEGWYGKAAIDRYTPGGWYSPGGFNTAVALPVLPALELAVFHFTGPGLAAARLLVLAVFAVNLLLVYFLVCARAQRWTALLAVTLLASNAFLYAFSRLAILESLLVFFLLVSWILAIHLPRKPTARTLTCIACGFSISLMVLAKTTAIFVIPSTVALLWANSGSGLVTDMRARTRTIATAALSGLLLWGTYYLLKVRPHYLTDYHYLFTANAWGHPSNLRSWCVTLWYTAHGLLWISPSLAILSVILFAGALIFFRSLWHTPLFIASLLAIVGYLFFIAWHDNMQPRYYQVAAYPLVIALALAVEHAVNVLCTADLTPGHDLPRIIPKLALGTVAAALALSTAANARLMLHWARHPEYTWLNAANGVTQYIDEHPGAHRLLLSISGDEITLATGLPAICDDYGTWDLTRRAKYYKPGWYAAWNELDPGTEADLESQYRLKQVASFPAFDDPDRNTLILYRLLPLKRARKAPHKKRPAHTSRPLQINTAPAQQPSGMGED